MGMCLPEYASRHLENCKSASLGYDPSTTGSAGVTTLPPMRADMSVGGVVCGAPVMFLMLLFCVALCSAYNIALTSL